MLIQNALDIAMKAEQYAIKKSKLNQAVKNLQEAMASASNLEETITGHLLKLCSNCHRKLHY